MIESVPPPNKKKDRTKQLSLDGCLSEAKPFFMFMSTWIWNNLTDFFAMTKPLKQADERCEKTGDPEPESSTTPQVEVTFSRKW